MESTVWLKSVNGPFTRMRSPTDRGSVNFIMATLIFEKKWVTCPISIMASSKCFASCILLYITQ